MPPRPCPAPLPASCHVSTCARGAGQGGMLLRGSAAAALRLHGEACPRVIELFNRKASALVAGRHPGCSRSWISSQIRRDPTPAGNPTGRSRPRPRQQGPEPRSRLWVWGEKIKNRTGREIPLGKKKLIVGVFFRPFGGAQEGGGEGEGAGAVAARSKEVNSRRGSEKRKTKQREKNFNFQPLLEAGKRRFRRGKGRRVPGVCEVSARCSRISLQVPLSEPLGTAGPQPAGP